MRCLFKNNSSLFGCFTILFHLISISFSQAQFERAAGKIVTDKQPGGIIETWNLEKAKEIEGSYFINEDWYVGSIELFDGRNLDKVPVKYNLRDDYLHIYDEEGEIRILNHNKIKRFNWFNLEDKKDQLFVNCLDFNINDTKLTGMAELLVEGKCDLLRYYRLVLHKGTYSVVHDAGQKYDEYTVEEEFYVNRNDRLHKVKNKKTLLKVFDEDQEIIKGYIKENRVNVRKEDGLAEVINYYNSL